jgi:Regulator of chromosome condensation (RCC1) repeat
LCTKPGQHRRVPKARLLQGFGLLLGLGAVACAGGGDADALLPAGGCLAQVAATYDFVRLVLRTDGSVWKAAAEPVFSRVPGASGELTAAAIAAAGSSAYSDAIGCAIVDGGVWCFPLAGPLGGASDLGAGPNGDATSLLPERVVDADSAPLEDVAQLSGGINGGGASFCAVKSDGSAWCWGYSEKGLLGPVESEHTDHARPLLADTQTPLDHVLEVRVGYASSCARKDDGSVWCWGDNSYGELGFTPAEAEPTTSDFPIQIALPSAATRLVASPGNTHCAILADTTVECWGRNNYEQVGAAGESNSAAPTLVLTGEGGPPLNGVSDLAPDRGMEAMCANTTSAGLWCWGHAFKAGLDAEPTGPYAAPVYEAKADADPIRVPLSSFGATNGSLVFVDGKGRLVLGAGSQPTAVQPPCP